LIAHPSEGSSEDPANDRDYTALDIIRQSANPSVQDQISQEIRLASNGKRTIEWVGGVHCFDQNVTTTGVTEYGRDASYWVLPAGTPDALLDGYTVFNDSSIDTTSYAVSAIWAATSATARPIYPMHPRPATRASPSTRS